MKGRAAVLTVFMFLGMANFASSQVIYAGCSGITQATTRAYPNGSINLCWEFPEANEPDIDGFWLFRSARTGNNMDGMLGTFSKVATIQKNKREFVLSGSKGTYSYFLCTFKGATPYSVASNQFKVIYTP